MQKTLYRNQKDDFTACSNATNKEKITRQGESHDI